MESELPAGEALLLTEAVGLGQDGAAEATQDGDALDHGLVSQGGGLGRPASRRRPWASLGGTKKMEVPPQAPGGRARSMGLEDGGGSWRRRWRAGRGARPAGRWASQPAVMLQEAVARLGKPQAATLPRRRALRDGGGEAYLPFSSRGLARLCAELVARRRAMRISGAPAFHKCLSGRRGRMSPPQMTLTCGELAPATPTARRGRGGALAGPGGALRAPTASLLSRAWGAVTRRARTRERVARWATTKPVEGVSPAWAQLPALAMTPVVIGTPDDGNPWGGRGPPRRGGRYFRRGGGLPPQHPGHGEALTPSQPRRAGPSGSGPSGCLGRAPAFQPWRAGPGPPDPCRRWVSPPPSKP